MVLGLLYLFQIYVRNVKANNKKSFPVRALVPKKKQASEFPL